MHARWRRTGLLAGIGLWTGLLAACGTVPEQTYLPHTPKHLEAGLQRTWELAIRTLAGRGYRILSADRTAGIIETEWHAMNPGYAASIFLTRSQDRYSTCGKPRLGRAYHGKEVQIRIRLWPVPSGDTELLVRAAFRTTCVPAFLSSEGQPVGQMACASKGLMEEELATEIQLRTLGERLERLHRGAP
jgi:hypothetical protein